MRRGLITIRAKLTLNLMLVSTVAVFGGGVGYIAFTARAQRRAIVNELGTLAEITGRNCEAALAFNMHRDAEDLLAALHVIPSVVSAHVLNTDGVLFAAYRRDSTSLTNVCCPMSSRGYSITNDLLCVCRNVEGNAGEIGTLCIQDDMSTLRAGVRRNTGVVVGVMLLSLAGTYMLSSRLAAVISSPILSLTHTARAVSERKDYSVRADQQRADELGVLNDTLNEMLAGIQDRDCELRSHRDHLEELVATRAAELKQTNVRLTETLAELERSNRELQKFAQVASHDLQEPLRKICSFGDRLQQRHRERLGEDGRADVDRMLRSALRMVTLVDDLRAFSSLTRRPMEFSPVDMNRVTRVVVDDLNGMLEQTHGRVVVGDLPRVIGDSSELGQLMHHLIHNALKFHRPGEPPVVEVSAGGSSGGKADASDEPDGEWFEIRVSDNGIGMDEKYRDRIFQVFQRLHGQHEYGGTGIGLAICERIAARHGGSISMHSTPGQGSVFVVRLPRE